MGQTQATPLEPKRVGDHMTHKPAKSSGQQDSELSKVSLLPLPHCLSLVTKYKDKSPISAHEVSWSHKHDAYTLNQIVLSSECFIGCSLTLYALFDRFRKCVIRVNMHVTAAACGVPLACGVRYLDSFKICA